MKMFYHFESKGKATWKRMEHYICGKAMITRMCLYSSILFPIDTSRNFFRQLVTWKGNVHLWISTCLVHLFWFFVIMPCIEKWQPQKGVRRFKPFQITLSFCISIFSPNLTLLCQQTRGMRLNSGGSQLDDRLMWMSKREGTHLYLFTCAGLYQDVKLTCTND